MTAVTLTPAPMEQPGMPERVSVTFRVAGASETAEFIRADLVAAKDAEISRLRAALEPFADMSKEMFARNWNSSSLAIALDNPGDPHRLYFRDFLAAHSALQPQPKEAE